MKIRKKGGGVLEIISNNYFAYVIGVVLGIVGIALLAFPNIGEETVPFWVGLLFVASSVLPILFTKKTKVTIDKANKKIFVSEKGLIGKYNDEHALSTLKSVDLITTLSPMNRSRRYNRGLSFGGSNNYRYHLELNLGKDNMFRLGSTSSIALRKKSQGKEIASFAGVPFKQSRPSGIESIAGAVRTMGGIFGGKDSEKEN